MEGREMTDAYWILSRARIAAMFEDGCAIALTDDREVSARLTGIGCPLFQRAPFKMERWTNPDGPDWWDHNVPARYADISSSLMGQRVESRAA
jgi:hypothetical protein